MESFDTIWQVGILALLAGIMIGLLGYRLFGRSTRESDKVQAELDATRAELNSYRVSVNEHFDKTSELVNDLTQNYVRVYQHLAEGATTLGDGRTFNNLIERHPGKVSLTVDGEARPSATNYDESVVEAAAPADVPPAAAEALTGAPAQEPAAETAAADESTGNAAAGESAAVTDAAVETNAGGAAEERGQEAETPRPTADAGAPGQTSGEERGDTAAGGASVIPEDDEKTSRTVH